MGDFLCPIGGRENEMSGASILFHFPPQGHTFFYPHILFNVIVRRTKRNEMKHALISFVCLLISCFVLITLHYIRDLGFMILVSWLISLAFFSFTNEVNDCVKRKKAREKDSRNL